MWEKDKLLLRAFKECYANMREQINAGEEVDIATTCVEETEALVSYTNSIIGNYKNNTAQEVGAVKQRYYNPKVPYFQNLWAWIANQKEVVIYMLLKSPRFSCLRALYAA